MGSQHLVLSNDVKMAEKGELPARWANLIRALPDYHLGFVIEYWSGISDEAKQHKGQCRYLLNEPRCKNNCIFNVHFLPRDINKGLFYGGYCLEHIRYELEISDYIAAYFEDIHRSPWCVVWREPLNLSVQKWPHVTRD